MMLCWRLKSGLDRSPRTILPVALSYRFQRLLVTTSLSEASVICREVRLLVVRTVVGFSKIQILVSRARMQASGNGLDVLCVIEWCFHDLLMFMELRHVLTNEQAEV